MQRQKKIASLSIEPDSYFDVIEIRYPDENGFLVDSFEYDDIRDMVLEYLKKQSYTPHNKKEALKQHTDIFHNGDTYCDDVNCPFGKDE